MNLRCSECGRQSYSASPDAVVRNGIQCECGGVLVQLEEQKPQQCGEAPDGGDEPVSGV